MENIEDLKFTIRELDDILEDLKNDGFESDDEITISYLIERSDKQ